MPDPTILNQIVSGDYAGASAAMNSAWPTAFLDTIQAAVLAALGSSQATSLSSVAVGTGAKNFVLGSSPGWKAGTPVYIMATADPANQFMVGKLASDAVGPSISVTVSSATGAGSYASWTVLVLSSATTVASPPLALAGGGSGASTAAGARTAFETIRQKRVKTTLNVPPGAPVNGDAYLVGTAPTGAWAGKAGQWATWSSGAWSFEVPADGDQTIETNAGTGTMWRSFGGNQQVLTSGAGPITFSTTTNLTLLASDLASGRPVVVFVAGSLVGVITLTLPTAASLIALGVAPRLTVIHDNGDLFSVSVVESPATAIWGSSSVGPGAAMTFVPGSTKWWRAA